MSQIFSVFGVEWKILLVQIVNFAVLLGILWYLLYKPLTKLIEGRRAQIIEGVAKAERAENMLNEAGSKKAEIITQATLKAESIIAQARETGKSKEEVMTKLAQEKAARLLEEARARSEELKRQTLDESREEIAALVVLGIEKTLRDRAHT
jgi:F-type H+-transporting ATPase subunit b